MDFEQQSLHQALEAAGFAFSQAEAARDDFGGIDRGMPGVQRLAVATVAGGP